MKKFMEESFYSRTFLYTGISVLINGTDKTSLELVQMGRRNKVKKKLEKKYKNSLEKPLESPTETSTGNIVWMSWLQGEENAPIIVQQAIKSVRKNFPNRKVILIDNENLTSYVHLPDFVMEKWNKGLISNTHFSDLLRLYLLIEYGGVWVDATVFIKKVPADILKEIDKGLFFFQNLRPGQSGNAIWLSSWLLSARKNEPVLKQTYELLMKYWKKNRYIVDYFLFHIFLHLVLKYHPEEMLNIKKIPNSLPLMLMYQLRDKQNPEAIKQAFNEFPIQKVTYKNMPSQDSNYNYLEDPSNVKLILQMGD
ncbi:capsular polysaccharide synthesis protein [Lactiplantibacillus plantarum]|uniref:capsular polysaccharide synthesis protein n=1 Tax=Lactiplantibacillus plantarum TaxID=1590 RepID=UPI001379F2CC|nr:capsular polysaccharide synthesis protein [Lactiplantibacillus plantarum]QOF02335.1 glycosyl transferase [Lactiplantibacillus plantarum]